MFKLFIVEDDRKIAGEIKRRAAAWGMDAHVPSDFRDILAEFERFEPHIVLLDISLPYFNGYHWCSEIRKIADVPIIFISSAADNMNMLMALNMGADDFIAKPFDGDLLIAKISALLRRSYGKAPMQTQNHRGATLDRDGCRLIYNGREIPLTKNEYLLTLCLMENIGSVVSRERLMERLWKTERFIDDNTLTVNINRLRRKLEDAGLYDFITTRFGIGYIIEK